MQKCADVERRLQTERKRASEKKAEKAARAEKHSKLHPDKRKMLRKTGVSTSHSSGNGPSMSAKCNPSDPAAKVSVRLG